MSYIGLSGSAVATDGTVCVWGSGANSSIPKQVPAPTSPKIISARFDSYFLFLLDASGVAWRSINGDTPTAVSIPGGRRIVQLTKTAMALASDGTVWSLGGGYVNTYGQQANGTFNSSSNPVQAVLPAGTSTVKIASYSNNTAVLLNNNTIWVAGSNKRGQLGAALPSGSNSNSYAYLQQFQVPSGKTWKNVSVGNDSVAAIASDGTIYIAGYGDQGQLGNGTQADSNVPVKAFNPDRVSFGVVELSGNLQIYAVDQNGSFWAWGGNVPSSPMFGNGDAQYTIYSYPVIAATGLQYQGGAVTFKTCDNGATPNAAGYCPFTGQVAYTVSYRHFGWSATAAPIAAATTPVQTGVAVLGGPGGSGMCLNIQGNSSAQGTPVVLATCDSSASGQKWTTWSDGTFRANGKCLD